MKAGENEPLVFSVVAFSEKLGVSLKWLIGLLDDPAEAAPAETPQQPTDVVMIPILDVQAAAGAGRVVDVVKAEAEFAFPVYFLRKLIRDPGRRPRLSSVRSKGDSMEPTILDGALLIIDEAQRDLPKPPSSAKLRHREPDIFVFFTSEGLRLKRLSRIDDDLVAIISDNFHERPPEVFRLGEDRKLSIIGKVIWWDNRL
jgi:phage repressor protein C with HTH and peptisase S24 domain